MQNERLLKSEVLSSEQYKKCLMNCTRAVMSAILDESKVSDKDRYLSEMCDYVAGNVTSEQLLSDIRGEIPAHLSLAKSLDAVRFKYGHVDINSHHLYVGEGENGLTPDGRAYARYAAAR